MHTGLKAAAAIALAITSTAVTSARGHASPADCPARDSAARAACANPNVAIGGERLDVGARPTPAGSSAAAIWAKAGASSLRAPTTATMHRRAYRKVLTLTQVPQQRSNWCGPATVYMIMKSLGRTTSAYRPSDKLSQSVLATSTYTGAGASGGTDWTDHDMSRALNRWEGSGWKWAELSPDPKHPEFLWDYVFMNISNGHPVAADMAEVAGGHHYNGHPNRAKPILHWTAIYGMSNIGGGNGTLSFADPAAKSPAVGWAAPAPTFTMSVNSVVAQMVGQGFVRGIVW